MAEYFYQWWALCMHAFAYLLKKYNFYAINSMYLDGILLAASIVTSFVPWIGLAGVLSDVTFVMANGAI